jgi:CubicO group peptidase (beta-lactamase class C family)
LENRLQKMVEKNQPPGISVAVVKEGQLIYSKGFGWADSPLSIPAASDTVYHWWSMTKVPTALAILKLAETGKLGLDNPVSDYLPFIKPKFGGVPVPKITIRQLLRHTSGFPDPTPEIVGWVHYEHQIYNQTKLVELHYPKYNRLKFVPDSGESYTNFGYMVLGAVIEAVSSQSYEEFMHTEILIPLGMTQTGFLYSPEMEGNVAAGTQKLLNFYTPLLPLYLDPNDLVREREGGLLWFNPVYVDVTPSTGLIGSVEEAALLLTALLERSELLSPESHDLLLPRGSNPTERPLGWATFNISGRLWLQHSGGGPGFASVMRLYPEEKLGIVIMSNNTKLPREALVDAFASLEWYE